MGVKIKSKDEKLKWFWAVIPAVVLIVLDCFFRWELLTWYQSPQLIYYAFSVLISASWLVFIFIFLKSILRFSWLYFSIMLVVLLLYVFSFGGSLSYFSLNGVFPNYYTFLYFKTEPKSAFLIIRDALNLASSIGLTVLLFTLVFLVNKFVKNAVPSVSKRGVLIYFLIQLFAFETMVYLHSKYDQCAVVDVNFAACAQRHIFTWDDHSDFKGQGLEKRTFDKKFTLQEKSELNYLVVVMESARRNSFSLYGNKVKTSPKLDAFVAENSDQTFVFRKSVSVASTTMLAVPAILTGIATHQPKTDLYNQPLLWDWAKVRQMKRYFWSSHTLKWYRFDQFYANADLDVNWNKDNSGKPYFNDLGVNDQLTVNKLKSTIGSGDQPFFGVIQFNTTHYPYNVPQKFQRWNDDFVGSYNNAVRYQDELLGQIFDFLKEKDLLKNTVVMLVADHGESLMEHHAIGHVETNYTEAISIPMLLYLPKNVLTKEIKENLQKNTSQLTSNIDLAPTIFDLLHLKKDRHFKPFTKKWKGYSLFQEIPDSRLVISLNNNEVANFNTGLSVCTKNWHYLLRTNRVPNSEEFYNWKKDPNEQRSLPVNSIRREQILRIIRPHLVLERFVKKLEKRQGVKSNLVQGKE